SHVTPYIVKDLGNTAGQQVVVTSASTAGLAGDYDAPGLCGVAVGDDGADAIYKFTPATTTSVRVVYGPSGYSGVVALFDGESAASPVYPLLKNQAVAMPTPQADTNEAP